MAATRQAETLSPAIPDIVEKLAVGVLERACALNVSIATAESCTGGLLGSLLTDVEGASHAFERGFIVYSEESKCELLGIERNKIADCGAVSRDVAIAMAQGALDHSRADIAVSITGFAGAGAPGDEPGLVHFACVRRDGYVCHREMHFGDIGRGPVRLASVCTALEMIEEVFDAN